nr:MAG TPA: hypothetical protein [Caudoviricetes sp.]
MNPAHNSNQYQLLQPTHIWEKIKDMAAPIQWAVFWLPLKLGDTPNTIIPTTERNTRNRLFSVLASNAAGRSNTPDPIIHKPNQNLCVRA